MSEVETESSESSESCPLLSRAEVRGLTRRGSIRFSVRSSASFVEPDGPDGGWGWLVVLASFTCLCVLDGAAYTFGVFIDPLIEEMGGGRGQTSLAGSLLVATYAFTGPLASRLVNRYGTRKVSRETGEVVMLTVEVLTLRFVLPAVCWPLWAWLWAASPSHCWASSSPTASSRGSASA